MAFKPSQRRPSPPKPVNPFLRGLGFIILVGFLAGGYFGGEWFFAENARQGWVYIPPEFTGPSFAPWLFAKLAFAVIALILGFVALTIVYGIVNPPRLGERDAPPVRARTKKSR